MHSVMINSWLSRCGWLFNRGKSVLRTEGIAAALNRMVDKLTRVIRGESALTPYATVDRGQQYRRWRQQHVLTIEQIDAIRTEQSTFESPPILSFAMSLSHARPEWVTGAVDSFLNQLYPHWELWVYPMGLVDPAVVKIISNAAQKDARIKLMRDKQGSATIGHMLRALSSGTFVGVMGPQNVLAAEACFEIAKRISIDSDTDVVFSDHDTISPDGEYTDPFFKPGWNPDLLLSTNYLSPLCLIRRTHIERAGLEVSSQREGIHGLLLRVTESARSVQHIPKVLCHARCQGDSTAEDCSEMLCVDDGADPVGEALRRRGERGTVARITSGRYRVTFETQGMPLVSIIIPIRDRSELLRRCLESIEQHTPGVRYEVIVIDNGSTEDRTIGFLDSIAGQHRIIRCPGAFNYSAINNIGAAHASGEFLLFLNNDTAAQEPNWLAAMVAQVQRPGVGAVGAKLLYPDGSIQHAGVVLGVCGIAGHAFRFCDLQDRASHGLSELTRNCSAVTAACLLMSKQLFERIGGFNERLKVEYNDVDLCLRIRQQGFRIVLDPSVVLWHDENATRKSGRSTEDRLIMEELWGDLLERGDPYYNPNLTVLREDWSLRL